MKIKIIIALLFTLTACKSEYRSIEKVMLNQPDLPQEFRTITGIKIHALTQPTAHERAAIQNAFERVIEVTTRDFTNGIEPPDAWRHWTKFTRQDEYRVWLIEGENVVGAESPYIRGCPIVRTFNSATGFASGVTAGFELRNGDITPIFPLVIVGRMNAEQTNRPECAEHFENAIYHEFEHLRTANSTPVYLHFAANDVHPLF